MKTPLPGTSLHRIGWTFQKIIEKVLRKKEARMKLGRNWKKLVIFLLSPVFLAISGTTLAEEGVQRWEVLNPEGVIKIEPMKINPHPSTLAEKTVLLRWNGKHNGDKFLERVADLLTQKVKDIKIIKSWEVAPETVDPISGSQERSMELMKKLAAFKPDLVIGSQAD
ncbi:MAG: hypothetical protein H6Q41_3554 [Deltaproteobacteria bacterium]|jgi:hypothetical protein|nr:hypothetical protein [Deltaproteobacteria bacterium]